MSAGPRLLVTGASGSIGRRLRARLDAEHYDASYIVSPRSPAAGADSAVDAVDITDTDAVRAIVLRRRPDVIIHLASVTGAACEADPELAVAVNVDAVRSLAGIAADGGVSRVVLASTSAVYGDQYHAPIDETGPLVLTSRYADTKRRAELALAEATEDSPNLSAVALRIFNVYGPGMTGSLANRLAEATDDRAVTLAGLDSFVRDYIHVDDVARALLLAAEADLPDRWSILNIGSGIPTSNRALVAALAPVLFTETEARASYSCADVTSARDILGFIPSQALGRDSVS
jgi:nucleoside-diphosphate-sugar epimerase